jgi:hypothetical protein
MRDGVPPRSSGTGAVQASAVPKPLGRWLRPELGTFLLIDELKERFRFGVARAELKGLLKIGSRPRQVGLV